MKNFLYSIMSASFIFALTASPIMHAAEEVLDVEPTHVFVPVGFDNNDNVVVVVDGYLPDTCYRLRPALVQIDAAKNTIIVQPRAVHYTGNCLDVTVPFSTTVNVGLVPAGRYTITTKALTIKEPLDVKASNNAGPDDYLYLPIDRAQIEVLSLSKIQARLYGRFTNTCSKVEEVKVINSGKTLEVLPIMKQLNTSETGGACQREEVPFEHVVPLPDMAAGRHLLHVRSLNGQSVNEIFTRLK